MTAVLPVIALACVLASLPPARALAQGAGRFDGPWQVVLHCDAARDGAAGYTLRFPATVSNGALHGENGVRGQAGSLSLDGTIQPDGTALLDARGMTGDPGYVVGRLAPATPYAYHMRARFDGAHGTGSRVEVRPCEAVFTRP